jgi:hypothetical protein
VSLSIYAKWNREREKVIILHRDMLRNTERTIKTLRLEVARLKSEIARLERNQGKPPRTGQVRPAR